MISEAEFGKKLRPNLITIRHLDNNCQQKTKALKALMQSSKSYFNIETALKEMEYDSQKKVNV